MTASVRPSAGRKWLRSQQVRGFALGTLLALPLTAPAMAMEQGSGPKPVNVFAAFPVIDRDEMAQLRGGFNFAGLELAFGANVRTLIDDVVRMETIVQFTKAGLVSSSMDLAEAAANAHTARGLQLSNMAQSTASLVKDIAKRAVNASQAPAGQSNSTAVANAGNAQAAAGSSGQGPVSIDLAGRLSGLRDLADRIRGDVASAENPAANTIPIRSTRSGTTAGSRISSLGGGAQVDLSGLGENIQGVVLNDTKGLTAAIQELTRNRITSTVINQASNRNIEIELNLQVDVKNFSQFSESLRNSILNQRLSRQNQIL